MTQYAYVKKVNVTRLTDEILTSDISIALDAITANGENTYISFKASLGDAELVLLQTIVDNHIDEPLPNVITELPITLTKQTDEDDDKVPYVYSTSRPLGYLTIFAGAGDGGEGFANRGLGEEIIFNMTASDSEKVVNISFNEDVYVKDGALTSVNAPLGANICIDIAHPVYGVLDNFGVKVPVLGTHRWPLDTEDRALIPKGLIIRITCCNAKGIGSHEAPADFQLVGRLELFRKKNTVV